MTQSSITTLQSVLNFVAASREGYIKAASTVDRASFKSAFEARANERAAMADQLQTAIRAAGGAPEEEGILMGSVHRNLMSIASLIQSDEKAAIDTIDDGEERLREKVAQALDNGQLSSTERLLLTSIEQELAADARFIERMEAMAD